MLEWIVVLCDIGEGSVVSCGMQCSRCVSMLCCLVELLSMMLCNVLFGVLECSVALCCIAKCIACCMLSVCCMMTHKMKSIHTREGTRKTHFS